MSFLRRNFRLLQLFTRANYSVEITTHEVTSVITDRPKWDLLSAVSLERKPVVSRNLSNLEKRMMALLERLELEKSYKSNFELRMETDELRAKDAKSIDISDLDSASQLTAQDLLDMYSEELKSFNFTPRTTTSEKDPRTTNRCLDRSLILLVQEEVGNNLLWICPQVKRVDGETMREAAERALVEKCGGELRVKFLGNAPCGFYKYKYPKSVSSSAVGAKVFFFKALYLGGSVTKTGHCSDFYWATRSELDIVAKDYIKSVREFLIDEEH